MRNLRRAVCWIAAGNLRELSPRQIFSASLSAKFRITLEL